MSFNFKVSGSVTFYKQDKKDDRKDILLLPLRSLNKQFDGTGIAAQNSVKLSDFLGGDFQYNDVKDLTGDYAYTVSTTTKDDKTLFTIEGVKGEYKFRFVTTDSFVASEFIDASDYTSLVKGFTGAGDWKDIPKME